MIKKGKFLALTATEIKAALAQGKDIRPKLKDLVRWDGYGFEYFDPIHWFKNPGSGWEAGKDDKYAGSYVKAGYVGDIFGLYVYELKKRSKKRNPTGSVTFTKKVTVNYDTTHVFTPVAGSPVPAGTVFWKKVYHGPNSTAALAQLVALEEGIVPNKCEIFGTGKKFRVPRAKVLQLIDRATGKSIKEAYSGHDTGFTYRRGAVVVPANGWNDNKHHDCAAGIHGFATRKEAEAY